MPPITKNLIIINVLMYLAKVVAIRYGIDFDDLLGLHFFLASDFRLYQIFTYMFVHGGLEHIFFNMFAVWMFGRIMEQVMGSQRFLFYYIICGLGAGLVQEGVQYLQFLYEGLSAYDAVNIGGGMSVPMADFLNRWTTVGASGAVYGVLLSFGMTFPEERMFIIPIPVPIKAKWFVIGYAVIELMSALGNPGDGVAHMAHLGGMIFGLALILYWRKNSGNGGGRFFGGGGGYGGFGGYDNYFTRYEDVTNTTAQQYGRGNSLKTIWKRMRFGFSNLLKKLTPSKRPKMKVQTGGKHASDMQWRQQQQQRQEEIDHILQKVKQGGYNSLTRDEQHKLFEASGK